MKMWLSPARPENDTGHENGTIDVLKKGCFNSFDAIACARSSVLCVFMSVTALLCLARVIKLHIEKNHQIHQFLIFYIATAECILSAIYWASGTQYPQVDFSLSYLKLWQFVVICHFYWSLATRILHKESLVKQVIDPILAVYVLYFMVIASLGMADPKSSWIECFEPQWLFLSFAELLAVQLFMVAGIYITKKLNQISSDEAFKNSQKRDLWSVVTVYEISAIVCLIYDLTMKLLGDEEGGCSGIFGHDQRLYSLVIALFMIVKFILPVWVILCVFHLTPLRAVDHESVFGWSFDGAASASVFKPTPQGTTCCRHLHFPSSNNFGICGPLHNLDDDKREDALAVVTPATVTQGGPTGFTRGLQPMTPITEEDGISESLSSDRSSVPESGHLHDNQPLLKKGNLVIHKS